VKNYEPPLNNYEEYKELKSKSLSSLNKIKGRDDSYSKRDFKLKKRNKVSSLKKPSKPPLPPPHPPPEPLGAPVMAPQDRESYPYPIINSTFFDPRLKGEVQSFLEWIKDSEGLSGYINYYLQQNNTTIISELSQSFQKYMPI